MILRIDKLSEDEWFLSIGSNPDVFADHSTRIFSETVSNYSVAGLISCLWTGISLESRLMKLVEDIAKVLPETFDEGLYELDDYIALVELLR